MKNKVKGIILCGGRGSRLKDLGERIPKTLVEIDGRPMLEYIIENFEKSGIKELKIAVGHLSEKIEGFVKENYAINNFEIVDNGETASMLERISSCLEEDGLSIVMYGDTYIDMDLGELISHHIKSKKDCTMITGKSRLPWGKIETDMEGTVLNYKEKPEYEYYIGGLVLSNKLKNDMDSSLKELDDARGFVLFMQDLIKRQRVGSFLHEGFNISFNTLLERQSAEKEIKRYFTSGD